MESSRREKLATEVVWQLEVQGKTRKDLAFTIGRSTPYLRERTTARRPFTMDDLAGVSAFLGFPSLGALLQKAGVADD